MLGPFDSPPFDLYISPCMTRPKSGSEVRRTIVELRWPKGHLVNDGITNKAKGRKYSVNGLVACKVTHLGKPPIN